MVADVGGDAKAMEETFSHITPTAQSVEQMKQKLALV